MRKIPDSLIDELSIIKHRLLNGESLNCALKERRLIKVDNTLASEWTELVESINYGEIQSTQGIEYFLESLKLEKKCNSTYSKKTLTPRMEIIIISALLVLFNLVSFIQFPLNPLNAFLFSSVILILILFSYLMSKYFLNRFETILKDLGWIQFLQKIRFNLKIGRSFPVSLKTAIQIQDSHLSVKNIKIIYENFQMIASGQLHNSEFSFPKKLHNEETQMQWELILKHYKKGIPLLGSLDTFIESNLNRFLENLENKSEKLAFQMFIPIFLFLLPAFMISLLRPVWTLFSNF